MAELNTAEVEANADAAFGAGFGDTPPAEPVKVVEQAPAEPAKPVAAAEPPAKPVKPQYARVLQQDWDNLKAAAGKVATLESQLAKLAGSAPNAEQIAQQVIEKVQAQTPAGQPVEFSDEDFAEMIEYAPELATATRAVLQKIFNKANVKGTGADVDPAAMERAVEGVLAKRDAKQKEDARIAEQEALVKAHPKWSDDVGRPGDDVAAIPASAFRTWLATQPAEYQREVGETFSHAVIHAALDKFKASLTATPAPAKTDKATARRAVIEDAVTPRADGNPPPLNTPETAEEAFGKAFKRQKAH